MKNKKINKYLTILIFTLAIIFCINAKSYASIDEETAQKIKDGREQLTYEMFGAVGDGKTNDAQAIKSAHSWANNVYKDEGISVTVNGTAGKKYYIGYTSSEIEVCTSVNWNGATLIFDDYVDEDNDGVNDINVAKSVFYIKDKPQYTLSLISNIPITKITKGTKQLPEIIDYIKNVTVDELLANGTGNTLKMTQELLDDFKSEVFKSGKILIRIDNSDKKQFIRKGSNADSGKAQQDYFCISNSGEVLNDIIWDFENITNLYIYVVPENTVTIKNANIITYTNNLVYNDNAEESVYTYRGIKIGKSNVKIENINHTINETKHTNIATNIYQNNAQGNKYGGIIDAHNCSDLIVENSKFMPHQFVKKLNSNKEPTSTGIGSYDLQFTGVVNLKLNNIGYICTCTNSTTNSDPSKYCETCYSKYMTDTNRWGIIATNYIKELNITNSKLNRIDSHRGIHNLNVSNTTVGCHGFTLIGSGIAKLSNITVDESNFIIDLRQDYGSTWDGTINIEKATLKPVNTSIMVKLVDFHNTGDWDFGYECHYPNLNLKNITIDDTEVAYSDIAILNIDESRVGEISATRDEKYYFADKIAANNITRKSENGFKLFNKDTHLDRTIFANSSTKTKFYYSSIKLADSETQEMINKYNEDTTKFKLTEDNEAPSVSLSYSSEAAKAHSVKVNAGDANGIEKIQYIWSDSTQTPSNEEFTKEIQNNGTITKANVNGTYYLYVLVTDSALNTIKKRTNGIIFDNTSPELTVTYSTTATTNQNVTATIKSNEQIKEIQGWTLSADKLSATKTYANNTEETITVEDLVGNTASIKVTISNIDKEAPQLTVTYSTTSATNKNVTATIKSNKQIKEIQGWTLSADKLSATKTYASNTEETVTVEDLVGNTASIKITVSNIKNENNTDEGNNTENENNTDEGNNTENENNTDKGNNTENKNNTDEGNNTENKNDTDENNKVENENNTKKEETSSSTNTYNSTTSDKKLPYAGKSSSTILKIIILSVLIISIILYIKIRKR